MKKASNHPLRSINSTKNFTAWGLRSAAVSQDKAPRMFSFFFCFWKIITACRIQFPTRNWIGASLHWKHRLSTTGLPGNAQILSSFFSGLQSCSHAHFKNLPPSIFALRCTFHVSQSTNLFAMLSSCSSFPDSCCILVGSHLLHSFFQRSFFSSRIMGPLE